MTAYTVRLISDAGIFFIYRAESESRVHVETAEGWQHRKNPMHFSATLVAVEGWDAEAACVDGPPMRLHDTILSLYSEEASRTWRRYTDETPAVLALCALMGAQNRRSAAHDALDANPNDLSAARALYEAEDDERSLTLSLSS